MKNLRVWLLAGLLLAPVTAQAANVGNRVPTSGSTVLSDAEMDKAHGKFAPAAAAPLLAIPGVGEAALAVAAVGAAGYILYRGGEALYNVMSSRDTGNPAQDKPLTKGDIKDLKDAGHDPHELKQSGSGGKVADKDLYKDRDGNVLVKPKGGKGPGEPTGVNIKK